MKRALLTLSIATILSLSSHAMPIGGGIVEA